MKKSILAVLALLFASVASAQVPSYTPNIGLQVPAYGQTNWQVPVNYNNYLLDKLLSGNAVLPGLSVTGPATLPQLTTWLNTVTYPSCGQVYYLGTSYYSKSGSNINNLPTNGTYWTSTPCGGGGSSSGADTRPSATTSVVAVTVAANSSCIISNSPAAGASGQQSIGTCQTGTAAGPGTITHAHLTLGPASDNANVLQKSTITFNCDGVSQTAPLSLYLLTQDNPIPFSTDWNANLLGSSSSNFTGNRRHEIDFTTGCQVSFNNGSTSSAVTLYGEFEYRIGASVSRSSRQYWHMYYTPLTAVPQYTNFQMLPNVRDNNGGELESITLFTSSPTNGTTLEGYTTVVLDSLNAKQANGTEDFFGCGYYCVTVNAEIAGAPIGGHFSPEWGEFYSAGIGTEVGIASSSLQTPINTYDALLYRNFQTEDRDNALFTTTLSAFQPNGESAKPGGAPAPGTVNMASLVTFWTYDPMVATPTFSPAAGPVSAGTTVTISSVTSGATFCSSTSTAPASNGAGTCTSGATGASVVVTPPVTLQALASKLGFADSYVALASYTTAYSTPPTYATQCFNTVSGSTTSSVNCTLTPTAGDFIFAACSGNSNGNSYTVTSSPSNSFAQLTAASGPAGSNQASYGFAASGTSTTFSCGTSSTQYQGITVLDYHPGSVAALATSLPNSISSSTTNFVSGAISTTGGAFFITCAHAQFGPPTPTAGNINGTAATGRTMSSAAPMFCEDLSVSSSATSATGTLTGSSAGNWDGIIAAFN